jgi:hypothetical protein
VEEHQLQVVEIYRRVCGPEHPARLTAKKNLVSILYCLKKFEDAEVLQAQIFEIRKVAWGLKHPDTVDSLERLDSITYHVAIAKMESTHPATDSCDVGY